MASVMSLVMMIFILVPAIAPSLGQAMIHLASWRSIFLLYIAYSIIIGLWIMLRLERNTPSRKTHSHTDGAHLHMAYVLCCGNRTTTIYMLCMGLCFGSFIGYLGASQQIFQDHFGVGEAFSLYFGGLALTLGLASLLGSKFVVRLGMRYICMNAMSAMGHLQLFSCYYILLLM